MTNLTGTTWYVPSGWSAKAELGKFYIDLYFDNDPTYCWTSMYIGYGLSGEPGDFTHPSKANSIVFNGSSWPNYTPISSFAFTITDGDDVDDPSLIQWLTTYGIQLKVTDLTDTTWQIKSIECPAAYGMFNIYGSVSNDALYDLYLGYYADYEASPIHQPLLNSAFYTNNGASPTLAVGDVISIKGGTDVKNPKLIAWLSKWGELEEEEPETPSITDLTGYTVTVPSGWNAPAGLGYFDLAGFIDFANSSYPLNGNNSYAASFGVGLGTNHSNVSNSVIFYAGSSWYSLPAGEAFTLRLDTIYDPYQVILIQWLVDNNATFEKEGEEETVTISAGTYRFKDEVIRPCFNEDIILPIIVEIPIPAEVVSLFNSEYEAVFAEMGLSPIVVQDYTLTVEYGGIKVYYSEGYANPYTNIGLYPQTGVSYAPYDPTLHFMISEEEPSSYPQEIYLSYNAVGSVYEEYQVLKIAQDTEVSSQFGTWFIANTEPYSEEETPDTPEETPTEYGEIHYNGSLLATIQLGQTVILHTEGFQAETDIVIKNVGGVVEETPTGYTIDFSGLDVDGNSDTSTLTIYDGQDDSGKVVYKETNTSAFTLSSYLFTSGYFYITFESNKADDFNNVSATGGVIITSYSTSAAALTYATGTISGDGAISGSLWGDQ